MPHQAEGIAEGCLMGLVLDKGTKSDSLGCSPMGQHVCFT